MTPFVPFSSVIPPPCLTRPPPTTPISIGIGHLFGSAAPSLQSPPEAHDDNQPPPPPPGVTIETSTSTSAGSDRVAIPYSLTAPLPPGVTATDIAGLSSTATGKIPYVAQKAWTAQCDRFLAKLSGETQKSTFAVPWLGQLNSQYNIFDFSVPGKWNVNNLPLISNFLN